MRSAELRDTADRLRMGLLRPELTLARLLDELADEREQREARVAKLRALAKGARERGVQFCGLGPAGVEHELRTIDRELSAVCTELADELEAR